MDRLMADKLFSIKTTLDSMLNEYHSGVEVFEAHCFLHRSENVPQGAMVAQIITHRLVVTGRDEFTVKLGDKIICEGFKDRTLAHDFGLDYADNHFYLNRIDALRAANTQAEEQSTTGMARPMCL